MAKDCVTMFCHIYFHERDNVYTIHCYFIFCNTTKYITHKGIVCIVIKTQTSSFF